MDRRKPTGRTTTISRASLVTAAVGYVHWFKEKGKRKNESGYLFGRQGMQQCSTERGACFDHEMAIERLLRCSESCKFDIPNTQQLPEFNPEY